MKVAVLSDKEIFLYSVGLADKQLIERLPYLGSHSLAITPLALGGVLMLTGCFCQTPEQEQL